jgi:hypothetical protein
MSSDLSEKRLAENEVIFRDANKKIHQDLAILKESAASSGHRSIASNIKLDQMLQFYCECSDEKCQLRVNVSIAEYIQAHRNEKQFIIVPGHEVPEYEHEVFRNDTYMIVEKFKRPPQKTHGLRRTNLNNT